MPRGSWAFADIVSLLVEELRNQRERLRQSGIHAVQAVSASLSASSHLSQVLRHFVEELVGSGHISAHESPGSSPGKHQGLYSRCMCEAC
jgi:hypothetical protein